jgi:hypothetical protein
MLQLGPALIPAALVLILGLWVDITPSINCRYFLYYIIHSNSELTVNSHSSLSIIHVQGVVMCSLVSRERGLI